MPFYRSIKLTYILLSLFNFSSSRFHLKKTKTFPGNQMQLLYSLSLTPISSCLPPPPSLPLLFSLPHLLFFPSFLARRLALNVHHSAKNKRSELIGLSAAALVDPLIRAEKQHYMSEFCFSSSFWVLQLLHATVTSKVSPPPLSPQS